MGLKILVSAGEASGDFYASLLVDALKRTYPGSHFFGCAGPRMMASGVQPIVDMASLAVVGLVEVVGHIPRIYGEFRKLKQAIRDEKPDLAVLTDSPDFHLRLLPHLKAAGVPVVYLVAPQVWAWRRNRLKILRHSVDRLLCIFPFEEDFFRRNHVDAHYIGHPLARTIRPTTSPLDFRAAHNIPPGQPLVALLPGSRVAEAGRHIPILAETVRMMAAKRKISFLAGTPLGFSQRTPVSFWERFGPGTIQVLEGNTWDLLGAADLALAASGTVTVEAALLGCPMVTYYKVTRASWAMGKLLVRVPYYSMVNLVASKAIVPELMQHRMTAPALAAESLRLLDDTAARSAMKRELEAVAEKLRSSEDPMEMAISIISGVLNKETIHV